MRTPEAMVLLAAALGCQAEPIELYVPDAGHDAWAAPLCPSTSYRAPDGTWCEGHDEDCDGVPDRCDGCPGIADTPKVGAKIGDACRPLPFGTAWRRLHFEPFADHFACPATSLATSAPIAPVLGADLAVGGDYRTPGPAFVALGDALDDRVVVATAVLELRSGYGVGGVLLRVHEVGERHDYVGCGVDFTGLFVLRPPPAGCVGEACAPTQSEGVPLKVDSKRPIGVRATLRPAADDPDLDELECRMFDPEHAADTLTKDASTGWSTPPFRFARVGLPRGAVGVIAASSVVGFRWLDVLVAP